MNRYFDAVRLQSFNAEQIDLINRVAKELVDYGEDPRLEDIKADYADELNALA